MEDLNDIYFFASVVQYGGFSAAARTIGVEKTRLSRRIAALEKRLGVRLIQRTTRALALTEAGQRFFERCVATVGEHRRHMTAWRNCAGNLRGSFASAVPCCWRRDVWLMHFRDI
jgi:DNA-binding transcriptional LysR family regulator